MTNIKCVSTEFSLFLSFCNNACAVGSIGWNRVTIFLLRKGRTGFLKVITSADAQFSVQNQAKSKKKDHHVRKCPNFRSKSSEKQKKVITSADAQFSAQNQVKSKKKVITSADAQFSAQTHVKSKRIIIKGHRVRRCLVFCPKSSEEWNKNINKRSSRGISWSRNFPKFLYNNDLSCFRCSKCQKRKTFGRF